MSNSPLICFHDGDCPLCQVEIKLMQKLDKQQNIEFVDITKTPERLTEVGLNYQQAMQLLYVVDQNNTIKSGLDSFIALWEKLPVFNYLACYVQKSPRVKKRMNQGYLWFARHRLALTGRKGVDQHG